MSAMFRYSLGALLVVSMVLSGCDEDGLSAGSLGQIETFPRGLISFSKVAIGDEQRRALNITNEGTGPLTLFDIQWEADAEGPTDIRVEFPGGSFDEQVLLPDDVYRIEVVYAPNDEIPDSGNVVISSSDPNRSELPVEVITAELGPRIQVTPPQTEGLNFGQVAAGEPDTRTVSVTNVGELPLLIDDIFLNSTNEFDLILPEGTTFPVSIADVSEVFTFEVRYTPDNLGEDIAEVVINNNDARTPVYKLPILANSSSPCIQLSTESVNFDPPVGIGNTRTEVITIRSCGPVPLELRGITKTPESSGDILSFEPEPLDGVTLAPDETTTFELIYAPVDEGVDAAEFLVRSSDPLRPEVTVRALATGTSNQCPEAELQASVRGSGVTSKQLAAIPLDIIVLDATGSSDPESSIAAYNYELTQRPDGSNAIIENSDSDRAQVYLDLAGSYEVCLTVEDARGTPSCNTDCVQIVAKPNEKIHVQLIWTTPADKVVGDDDGTDLDLHFTRLPDGSWGDTGDAGEQNGWDIFFDNRSAVWDIPDGLPETPSLDIDDRDGDGPENVNLDNPNACTWYAVGVHYFDDAGIGLDSEFGSVSLATIRIYINGQLRFEKPNIPLDEGGVSSGDFWSVALIHWDGSTARVFETYEKAEGSEQWIGVTPSIPQEYQDAVNRLVPACAVE